MSRTTSAPWALGLFTYAEFVLAALLFLPVLALVALLHRGDPTRRVPGRWLSRLGVLASGITPLWRFRVEGERPGDIGERAYVVVANHESTADVFLLAWLPWDMRWVAKEEIFRFPLVGWLMRLAGHIPLNRGRVSSMRAMRAACLETLGEGLPVMLFPEGTRSQDGTLLPFRDGPFELAIEAGVPVLPVAIAGTRACRIPGSIWFGRARAIARVLPPLPTDGLALADAPALREAVRNRIAAATDSLRAELRA